MSEWPSIKARELLKVLLRNGWTVKRIASSHKTLSHSVLPDFVFAFHDSDEIGPKMLARIAKKTGLTARDFR